MNWTGGARARIKNNNNVKKKEFFAKQRLKRSHESLQPSCNIGLSRDLLYLNKVDSFSKTLGNNGAESVQRVPDINKKRRFPKNNVPKQAKPSWPAESPQANDTSPIMYEQPNQVNNGWSFEEYGESQKKSTFMYRETTDCTENFQKPFSIDEILFGFKSPQAKSRHPKTCSQSTSDEPLSSSWGSKADSSLLDTYQSDSSNRRFGGRTPFKMMQPFEDGLRLLYQNEGLTATYKPKKSPSHSLTRTVTTSSASHLSSLSPSSLKDDEDCASKHEQDKSLLEEVLQLENVPPRYVPGKKRVHGGTLNWVNMLKEQFQVDLMKEVKSQLLFKYEVLSPVLLTPSPSIEIVSVSPVCFHHGDYSVQTEEESKCTKRNKKIQVNLTRDSCSCKDRRTQDNTCQTSPELSSSLFQVAVSDRMCQTSPTLPQLLEA